MSRVRVDGFIWLIQPIVVFAFVFIGVRYDGAKRDVTDQRAIPIFVDVSNFDVLDGPVRRSITTTPSEVVRLICAFNGGPCPNLRHLIYAGGTRFLVTFRRVDDDVRRS